MGREIGNTRGYSQALQVVGMLLLKSLSELLIILYWRFLKGGLFSLFRQG